MLPSVAIPVGMLAALAVTAFGAHIGLPGEGGRLNPATITQTAPFNQPGVVEVAPGRYEAHILAGIWFFNPPEIHVPEGAEVTFVMTSKDVIHGFMLRAANINAMLLPGQITRVTARFPQVGTYPFLCHEYCGIAHHTMWGKVIVDPRS
jgi:cytochrome c oxidase subunit 2